MKEWIDLIREAKEQGISKEQIRSFIGGDNMQHPVIDQIETTGYPFSPQRESVGTDGLGNDVFPGDPILMLNDEFFLIELLESDAIEVLEYLGASYEIAK